MPSRAGSRAELCEELGDLLLQAVYHAQMAEEEGSFTFDDVVEAVCRQDDPPPSACLRRRRGALGQARQGLLGGDQGQGTPRTSPEAGVLDAFPSPCPA